MHELCLSARSLNVFEYIPANCFAFEPVVLQSIDSVSFLAVNDLLKLTDQGKLTLSDRVLNLLDRLHSREFASIVYSCHRLILFLSLQFAFVIVRTQLLSQQLIKVSYYRSTVQIMFSRKP